MTQSEFPTSWTDPPYVATVVGLLAFGALVFYSASGQSSLAVEEVTFVVLALTLPMTAAYELARRVG
jgi:hypothetical protein